MCFHLYLASPLTLSEIRAMLPERVTADPVHPALQRQWARHVPSARTVVTLRRGRCACDLAGERHADVVEDERRLRARYRKSGATRNQIIAALERHRDQRPRPEAPGHWAVVLAGLVAEHARNAGPAVYYLDFSPAAERMVPWSEGDPRSLQAAAVRANPATWLPIETPVLVLP